MKQLIKFEVSKLLKKRACFRRAGGRLPLFTLPCSGRGSLEMNGLLRRRADLRN